MLETATHVYIFEFKLSGTAADALAQIESKRYAEKYATSGKPLVLIGCAFDHQTRNLGPWQTD